MVTTAEPSSSSSSDSNFSGVVTGVAAGDVPVEAPVVVLGSLDPTLRGERGRRSPESGLRVLRRNGRGLSGDRGQAHVLVVVVGHLHLQKIHSS